MKPIEAKPSTVTLDPDRTHELARPFRLTSDTRSIKRAVRVMALPENEVHTLLDRVRADFGDRQLKIDEFLRRRFDEVSPYLLNGQRLSEERNLLLGGYFAHGYSLEAPALFNPSMVPHLDQSEVPPGALRFILSLRATAERHVSSILPSRYSLETADFLSFKFITLNGQPSRTKAWRSSPAKSRAYMRCRAGRTRRTST